MTEMTENERKEAARAFADEWNGRGDEKSDTHSFWLDLLGKVYGVAEPSKTIRFERRVGVKETEKKTGKDGKTEKKTVTRKKFIDGYIRRDEGGGILIEQKSLKIDLDKPEYQSGGTELTPFGQAERYAKNLPFDLRAKWVIVCNFEEFRIYDMKKEHRNEKPDFVVFLKDLENDYTVMDFLVDPEKDDRIRRETEISVEAGKLIGKLYDALKKQYVEDFGEKSDGKKEKTLAPKYLHDLNRLCVQLVFCFYAEDALVFGEKDLFHDYIVDYTPRRSPDAVCDAIIKLFEILNTPDGRNGTQNLRNPRDARRFVGKFPYVNGGLFGEIPELPNFTDEIVKIILDDCSEKFDWSEISPTVVGAVFESTLNEQTRRSGGMHYTSIENIHKVVDALFLDDLKDEFEEIRTIAVVKERDAQIEKFHDKIASLKFLDPACGSGNFLTETYLSLRRLENEIIKLTLNKGGDQILIGEVLNPIKVHIDQFYGIEINDFAVSVAMCSMWIAEAQMMIETRKILRFEDDFLPLKTYANIVEGNALRLDWGEIVPASQVDYIMGNPPFVGGMMMSREQHAELADAFPECDKIGEADYVVGWYAKAAKYITNTAIRCAFVSSNSICQGQSASSVWKPLCGLGVHIDFAYNTFVWDSESFDKAHVHVVIVGFSLAPNHKNPIIYNNGVPQEAKHINEYLLDADNVFIANRSKPLCDVPAMRFGSMPRDGGNFILTAAEREELISKEPLAEKWVHLYLGADEFIKNKKRYCLWLVGASAKELRSCKMVMERIEGVRRFRLASKAAATRKFAETPTLFCQIAQPDSNYIFVPSVSSERRIYVPIGFMTPDVITSNLAFVVPSATLYHFGVLTSSVHMAWTRAVCGRLEMRYRYSKDIVYNNFPWAQPTDAQREKIEKTAQGILDAREKFPDSSLADLYDPLTMPSELRKAHEANDRAVMDAYGFKKDMTEPEIVARLMEMYKELTER